MVLIIHVFVTASTDKDQLMYTQARLTDIQDLENGTMVENIRYKDILRVFSGDGPARQLEAGQKRGGNYGCLCGVPSKEHMNFQTCWQTLGLSLEDRRQTIIQGQQWHNLENGNINPFANLKKEEIIEELESRGIDTYKKQKPALQENLNEILHGICRPPALLLGSVTRSMSEQNLGEYEVLSCEPLHDIVNVIHHIIEELPFVISQPETKKELEKFAETTIKEKNEIKGSDARMFAIQLATFVTMKYHEGKIDSSIFEMVNSLIEIINIAYSPESKRSSKQILRLYNSTFKFAALTRSIFSNPQKLTTRKFFGSHFHSLTTHLPETLRIFNTRSIFTEKEERAFGELRTLAERTTNRKPGYIIENCIIRFQAQQNDDNRSDSFKKQDSVISKEARRLPNRPRTIFTSEFLMSHKFLVQLHLERIADFMLPGKNVWWHFDEDDDVIFHDGPNDPEFRIEGPVPAHFRDTSVIQECKNIKAIWKECINRAKSRQISLPAKMLRMNDKSGKVIWLNLRERKGLSY